MFRIIIGFILGIIVSQNSRQLPTPMWTSVILFVAIGFYVMYRFGIRDKNIAVANATAVAVAKATAEADAKAAAIAQSAVNVYLQSGQTPTMPEIQAIIDHTEVDYASDNSRILSSQQQRELDCSRNSTGSDLPFSLETPA